SSGVTGAVDRQLARRLVLDELFDLSLYQSLQPHTTGELRALLDRLIPIEARHFAFWRDFFDLHADRLDIPRRLKLWLIVLACRLFGSPVIHLVLEAIEVYGVRKYLSVWTAYAASPPGGRGPEHPRGRVPARGRGRDRRRRAPNQSGARAQYLLRSE